MTWLLKIKRRAQNAAVAWLDWPGEKAEGGEIRPYEGDGVPVVLSDDWPGAVSDWEQPWADAGPVDHAAWMKSMTNPQTPDEIRRASIGAQRLRAAMHQQALQQGDEFIHEATDGGKA